MTRKEFSKSTLREGLHRAQGKCEAIGKWYGLAEGQRCNGNLSHGFEGDHIISCSIGGDNSLDNLAVVCKPCHKIKTGNIDTPRAAETKRMSDKYSGVHKPKSEIQSQGFRSTKSNTKYIDRGPWHD